MDSDPRNVVIEVLDEQSPHLSGVMALGRRNSATLGFMPEGGFVDHARRRQILAAIGGDGLCVGYAMYRVSRGRAIIVHFCVDESRRGTGLSGRLASRLFATTEHLDGVGLFCRQDYHVANRRWPKLGFTAVNEKPGRGRDQIGLIFWWRANRHPDLFSIARERVADESHRDAVIDMNIMVDLHGPCERSTADTRCLQADWVQPLLELRVTQEVANEVVRNPDREERQLLMSALRSYKVVETQPDDVAAWTKRLRVFFPEVMTDSDESDLRHLAHSAAAGATTFVTRDDDLMRICDRCYDITGVQAVTPVELVSQLDGEERPDAYQPALLAGSKIRVEPLDPASLDQIAARFCRPAMGESKAVLKGLLATRLAEPRAFKCRVALRPDGVICAVMAVSCQVDRGDEAEISILRGLPDNLGWTLVRQMLWDEVREMAARGIALIRFGDPRVDDGTVKVLTEAGFVPLGDGFARLCLDGVSSGVALTNRLREVSARHAGCEELLARAESMANAFRGHGSPENAADLERMLWPVKLDSEALPSYLVPIKPQFASLLIDRELAAEELFGPMGAILAREAVFFRSRKGTILRAPGRILWYVSRGGKRAGPMAVRACSRLEEVVVDEAKAIYRRFRRLGVYEWEHLMKHTQGAPREAVMALRFADTEFFARQVSAEKLKGLGLRGNIQSPRQIPVSVFNAIYSAGRGRPL